MTQLVRGRSGKCSDNSCTCAFGKRNATKKLELGMRGSSIVAAGTAMLRVLLSASLIMALTGGCVPCSALNSNAKDDHKCCSRKGDCNHSEPSKAPAHNDCGAPHADLQAADRPEAGASNTLGHDVAILPSSVKESHGLFVRDSFFLIALQLPMSEHPAGSVLRI